MILYLEFMKVVDISNVRTENFSSRGLIGCHIWNSVRFHSTSPAGENCVLTSSMYVCFGNFFRLCVTKHIYIFAYCSV